MATPHIYKIGTRVMCYGRPVYVIAIQHGHKTYSTQDMGIYYDLARDKDARRPDYSVHQSQVAPMPVVEEMVVHKPQLVKA